MTQLQNDNTPYKRFVVTSQASVPNAATGTYNIFFDTDNLAKKKDSAGTVDALGAATNSFATIAVSGQSNVVADSSTDTLTLVAGTGIFLTTNAGADSVTIISSGTSSGGGLVLLEQHTASASASLDFTTCISSTYDEYMIELINIVPATDSTNLLMRMSTDGGSTYDAGSNYAWAVHIFRSGATAVTGAENGATEMNLTNYGVKNTAGYGFLDGSLKLFNPASASLHKRTGGVTYFVDTSSYRVGVNWRGDYLVTTAVNAFRFLMSSGNITSGTIRVYGVAK